MNEKRPEVIRGVFFAPFICVERFVVMGEGGDVKGMGSTQRCELAFLASAFVVARELAPVGLRSGPET
ncbi:MULTISPECIES: hypothetical protein [Pseudomonas]|uniref:hypothetical protein n=1 Tax=Pseudomonas TaxID=286 RepID=UPI000AE25E04|nr:MULTISPECIES: hypothetical protein [Pseudomonas]UOK40850.1 hypothetical protein MJP36_13710 [Pseudomonas palleroniana]